MRKAFAALILIILLLMPLAAVAGYKITKVIDVGQGGSAVNGTVRWSPNGTQLAYFRGQQLYVSDTLGHSRLVTDLGLLPFRCEWASDSVLVLHLQKGPSGIEHVFEIDYLATVDVASGQIKILKEYRRLMVGSATGDTNSFVGPKLTLEGHAYYQTNVDAPSNSKTIVGHVVNASKNDKDSSYLPGYNHYVDWGSDGAYLFNVAKSDSIRIGPAPFSNIFNRPELNRDRSYYAIGGILYRFADSTYIYIDSLINLKPYPAGAIWCGICRYGDSFNPAALEIVCNVNCEAEENVLSRGVGIFDIVTHEFIRLNSIIGKDNCEGATYSPDGRMIACRCNGHVCIIVRERE